MALVASAEELFVGLFADFLILELLVGMSYLPIE
jgi:hypothetical protein